jgi:hypothetical protein
MRLPPFATVEPTEMLAPDEVALALDASSLDFLRTVYRDPAQPLSVRMRAAIAALAFEHPKLSVNANINSGFASRLEAMMVERGQHPVIDGRPNFQNVEVMKEND